MDRRGLLKRTGSLLFAGLAGGSLSKMLGQSCSVVASPALTEGPYFVDENLNRSDIRTDPTTGVEEVGYPLVLDFNVYRTDACSITPLVGAAVDIWHCNAQGLYSDQSANNSVGKKYLRGYQMSDRYGNVRFVTIFPGWYQGRAVHIHWKVRTFSQGAESYEYTSQFFFDDAVINEVLAKAPYASKGSPDTRNATDGIFNGASSLGSITSGAGNNLLLSVTRHTGYVSAGFNIILDVSAGSSPDQTPGGGGVGGPGGGGMPPGGTPPGGTPPGGMPPGPRP